MTSFYAGFVIFSVLGFMATNKETEVANVVDDGRLVNDYISVELENTAAVLPSTLYRFASLSAIVHLSLELEKYAALSLFMLWGYMKVERVRSPASCCIDWFHSTMIQAKYNPGYKRSTVVW